MKYRQVALYFAQIFVVIYTTVLFVTVYRIVQTNSRPSPCAFLPTAVRLIWATCCRIVYGGQFVFSSFALFGFMRHRILQNCSYEWNGVRKNLPHIRLVIVTVGKYSQLVMESVKHHFEVLRDFGWPSFEIVVLTEKSLPEVRKYAMLANSEYSGGVVTEALVPSKYQTTMGTLYKARNLEYARLFLPALRLDNWVVHLDEDTLIHASAVNGMARYMSDAKSPPVGQGAFAYGWDGWSWSLPSNAIRTGIDLCHHYSIARLTRRSPSLVKGGMFLVRYDISKHLSFDFGPNCSLIEDIAMSRRLAGAGIEWGWMHGVVTEPSPTFGSYIRQRAMWTHGIILTLSHCREGFLPFLELATAVFFWQGSSLLGLASPLWFACSPVDDHMPVVDDFHAIAVAMYACSMLFGLLFSFRLSFKCQMICMVLHVVFPFVSLLLTMYTCWIDLVGLTLGTLAYMKGVPGKKAPERPLTDKNEPN